MLQQLLMMKKESDFLLNLSITVHQKTKRTSSNNTKVTLMKLLKLTTYLMSHWSNSWLTLTILSLPLKVLKNNYFNLFHKFSNAKKFSVSSLPSSVQEITTSTFSVNMNHMLKELNVKSLKNKEKKNSEKTSIILWLISWKMKKIFTPLLKTQSKANSSLVFKNPCNKIIINHIKLLSL